MGLPAMSPVCAQFITQVLKGNWMSAIQNLNGLNMYELLRGISALDPLDRADLMTNGAAYGGMVNMPRIKFAYDVVTTLKMPSTPALPDFADQVPDATTFLSNWRKTPLFFDRDLTGTLPGANTGAARLAEADWVASANALGVEAAAEMAVARVEAGSLGGFAGDGRPTLRYELHIFGRKMTSDIYNKTHPYLSQHSQALGDAARLSDSKAQQSMEWSMMYAAMILRRPDGTRRTAEAFSSASWGRFQVMGFNALTAGWADVGSFVRDMFVSEQMQLKAFSGFLRGSHLINAMKTHDWVHVATKYNGSNEASHHYHQQLGTAYDNISASREKQKLPP